MFNLQQAILKHWQNKKGDWIAATIVIHQNVKFMLAPKVKSNYWEAL
ncbi:unknown [Odoribacter splanchnicus CAG:14]|nr:unknown [Odoribacter splanchnicus CAG:14]